MIEKTVELYVNNVDHRLYNGKVTTSVSLERIENPDRSEEGNAEGINHIRFSGTPEEMGEFSLNSKWVVSIEAKR